jgi:hypothetical protein
MPRLTVRGDQSDALVAMLVAAFDAVMSRERLLVYSLFLADLDEEIGARVVATWIARETRFPMIAELRQLAERLGADAPPDIDQAWGEVHKAMRAGRAPFRWSHDSVRLAVEAIGFRELCMSNDLSIDRAHFARAFEAARRRTADRGSADVVQRLLPNMRELMEAPAQAAAAEEARRAELDRQLQQRLNPGKKRSR